MARRLLDLDLRETRTVDQLLAASSDPVKVIFDAAAPVGEPPPWLLSTPVPERIRRAPQSGVLAPALGLAALTQCRVFGQMHLGDESTVYTSNEFNPIYVSEWAAEGRNNATTVNLAGLKARKLAGLTMVITHFNFPVYGHWLLESLPKLLYLRRIASALPRFRIVIVPRRGDFVGPWIRHVMPSAEIIRLNPRTEYLMCEKVLLPLSLSSTSYDFHPLLGDLVDQLTGRPEAEGDKLYVTREQDSRYRFMTDRAEIQEIARTAGFRLVSPETLPIPEQVALFARSRVVVGEYGSGLHNALFSPPGACVLGVNWINMLQSRIGQLRRHRIGFVLPSDGEPLLYDPDDPGQRGYRIDPVAFKRALDDTASAAGRN